MIDTPDCQFRIDGVCAVAQGKLSGLHAGPAIPTARDCYACVRDAKPRTWNRFTRIVALRECADGDCVHAIAGIKPDSEALDEILAGTGPGSQLWRLLASLGIQHAPGCDCLALAAQMNAWGVAGCRLARKEIVDRMRSNAKAYGWTTVAAAAAKAVQTGLAWRLNLADVYGSLVDEAIRRAEQNDVQGVPTETRETQDSVGQVDRAT